MKNIVIFEDGKSARGSRAKLIKRDKRRVLIQFLKYNFETDKDEIVTEWFKVYVPSFAKNKKDYKYENKRKQQSYIHEETNEFYCEYYQTEEYRLDMKKYFNKEYYDYLFGDIEKEKLQVKISDF